MAFGGGLGDSDDGVMSEINMTPLVDVMPVLLVIFIIAVPALTHTMRIDLPRASAQLDQLKPETIVVSVAQDGHLHWNRDPVSAAQFEQRLQQAAIVQPQPALHIRGDRKGGYDNVVDAMAAAQRAGILKPGFVTEQPAERFPF